MKKLIIAMAALLVSISAYGQGAVTFNNRITGVVVAQVTDSKGAGVSDGWEAQLFGGPVGGALVALTPKTTFRTGAAAGYVVPVDVVVPGVAAGATASLQMKAFTTDGKGSGASKVFNVSLGGGTLPPANLVGLEAFTVTLVPEPTTIALGILGAAGLLALRRRK